MTDDVPILAAVVGRQTLDLNVYAAFLPESLSGALPAQYVTVEDHPVQRIFLRGLPSGAEYAGRSRWRSDLPAVMGDGSAARSSASR